MTLLTLAFTLFALFPSNPLGEPTEASHKILLRLNEILSEEENWTQKGSIKDDHIPNEPFNLNQALEQAYIDVIGSYKHRGKASKTLRKAIVKHPKYEKHFHPINGFNAQENIEHSDILKVIQNAINIL